MLDGVGSGGEHSGVFAQAVADSLEKIDFSTVSAAQVQSKIAEATKAARVMVDKNPAVGKLDKVRQEQIACTIAMTATLADGALYSITAGDSHVWGYDQNGKRVISSNLDSKGENLLRRIKHLKEQGDLARAKNLQVEYDEMDVNLRGAITNSLNYTGDRGAVLVQALPDGVTYTFTLSDGYDKLGTNTVKFDELISRQVKAGKSATEIQAAVVEFWQSGLALPNRDRVGFGRDDFSFVGAQVG